MFQGKLDKDDQLRIRKSQHERALRKVRQDSVETLIQPVKDEGKIKPALLALKMITIFI